MMYYELTEQELCEKIGCVYQTLRTYLDGYKFANVERIKIWKYAPNQDMKAKRKRKHLSYKYVLSERDMLNLLRMRKRHSYEC